MKACPDLQRALANTVEKLRKERKLTKTALADFADLQDCYIRGITKGKRNPTVTAVYAICGALGIPVSTFFALVDEERARLSGERQ
ncbi:MAG: helix-turn-helix domain-containing protein [Desulfovibrio sp.]|nr:helix-turn-helix domain-containing protein [Desulfovibrio sp.]